MAVSEPSQMTRITQQQLESYLWGAAVLLRGTIDAGDYKQFIFPLLFYKRLCDVFDEETVSALRESGGDQDFALFPENHRFQIPTDAHWREIRKVSRDVGRGLQQAMRAIETANPNKLFGIFGDAQWTNKDRLTDAMLRDLIEHFSTLELTVANLPEDELGQGYEYLIKKFADDSGHTAAEFYTNRTVVHLMTEMLDVQPGESVYDPTCGSGGMLLSCITHLRRHRKEWRNVKLYGQERNLMTSSIARMNCFLHGIEDFRIERGDTLAEPKLVEGDRLQRFDVVLAKERLHSCRLRKGLAETLALLGTYPKALSSCVDGAVEVTARIAVKEILSDGNWELWASLNDVLPLLAEAAPDSFLEAVDSAIHSDAGAFNGVFAQEDSGVMGRNYITGVLWGLETLAWDASYLVQVCRLLADLAAIDPGGNWANRPSNSMKTILLPWIPQTCAVTEKRHAAVRLVTKRQPEVGWKLILSLLPQIHSSSSGTHKPIWRPFIPEDWKQGVSQSQHSEDILAYSRLAIEIAKTDIDKLAELVERYFHLPIELWATLRKCLVSEAVFAHNETDRFRLWSVLNRLVTNHRKFADHKNWKVPNGSLEELDLIVEKLSPVAPEVRHMRLFGAADVDLYEEMGTWEDQEQRLNVRRQDAVREIVGKGNTALLLQFAMESSEPWRVGFIFGSLTDLVDDESVLPTLLESAEKPLLQFAGGYVWARHKSGGWQWVDSISIDKWTNAAKGQFFTFLPFCNETWARVGAVMSSGEMYYWQNTSANPYESTFGIETALDKLITHDRLDVAIRCMQTMLHKSKSLPVSSAVRALQNLTTEHRLDAFAIGELLTFLQRADSASEADVRTLEWKFISFLGRFNNGHPVFLSRWLAEDPAFFCELIQTLYRSTNDKTDQPEPSEEEQAKATQAYHLLDEWTLPPGAQRDDSFSPDGLVSWVAVAKAKCLESGHWEVAAGEIGQVLRYAPHEENGLWIEPVCAVLDVDDHSRMRRGLTMEVRNGRGVYTPDGGRWETAAAEEWGKKADIAEAKGFSHLAQELRRLSDSYRHDAEREATRNRFEID